MRKRRSIIKQVFYFATGQLRVRKLEEKVRRLERDHYALLDRFTATVSLYEQRIDVLINSVARKLAEQDSKNSKSIARNENTTDQLLSH